MKTKGFLIIFVIAVIGVLVTCHRVAKEPDDDQHPADTTYQELLEHEGVHPHFPKEPKTRPPQHLD